MYRQKIAGFNLQEADVLRKAIGKKKEDLMAKVKKSFVDGAKKVGIVSEDEAEEILKDRKVFTIRLQQIT